MELRKSMVELDKFLNYLKNKDYSLNTINAYKKDLSIFLKFSNNKINVDYNFLRTYLQFLYNKKYSNKSISRNISSLKSFYKYLVKFDIIKDNPCLFINFPKPEKKLPNFI